MDRIARLLRAGAVDGPFPEKDPNSAAGNSDIINGDMTDRFHVLYDGQCSFCGKVVNLLIKANRPGKLEAIPSQDRARILADFPTVPPDDLEKAMYLVTPKGTFRGFFAFRRLMSTSPWFWPLLPVFYFPGAGWVGPMIYAWVARNRSRMGCEGDACTLPPPEQRPL